MQFIPRDKPVGILATNRMNGPMLEMDEDALFASACDIIRRKKMTDGERDLAMRKEAVAYCNDAGENEYIANLEGVRVGYGR